jgi:hypothetical protein
VDQLSFKPSVMVGMSIAAPLVDAPSQLGTAIALGFFYENDLREPDPLRRGHRLLITFGFNVLSLFSPDNKK